MSCPRADARCSVCRRAFFRQTSKRAAIRHERRVPERRFVFFAATLGGVGVLVGFYAAHHKIRKGYLMASVWALTLAELVLAVIWLI